MIAVLVLGDVEAFDSAIVAARGDDGDFALERHESFEDAGLAADLAPGRFRIAAVLDRRLALAVVAEAAGLQHRRPADALDRRGKIAPAPRHRQTARCRCRALVTKFFSASRSWVVARILRIGQHRNARGEKRRGLRRHVLEFIGDDVDVGGEAVERFGVGVIGAGDAMHDVESGRVGSGREDVALEAEPRRGQRQHAAELAAAENADRGLGLEHRRALALTRRPSALRRRLRSGAAARLRAGCRAPDRSSARTLAASSAALIAPAWPIASVPTGTPGGICTME